VKRARCSACGHVVHLSVIKKALVNITVYQINEILNLSHKFALLG